MDSVLGFPPIPQPSAKPPAPVAHSATSASTIPSSTNMPSKAVSPPGVKKTTPSRLESSKRQSELELHHYVLFTSLQIVAIQTNGQIRCWSGLLSMLPDCHYLCGNLVQQNHPTFTLTSSFRRESSPTPPCYIHVAVIRLVGV